MNVGDVVIPNPNVPFGQRFQLASGCSYYEFAICVSLEPFILVSHHADMMWIDTIKGREADFISLCKADQKIINKCKERIPSEHLQAKVEYVAFSKTNKSFAVHDSGGLYLERLTSVEKGWPLKKYKSEKIAKDKIQTYKRLNSWEWHIQEYHNGVLVKETLIEYDK